MNTSPPSYPDCHLIENNQSCTELYVVKEKKIDKWMISPSYEITTTEMPFPDRKVLFFANIVEYVVYVTEQNGKEIRFWSQLREKDDIFKVDEEVTGIKVCYPYVVAVLHSSITIYKLGKLSAQDRHLINYEHTVSDMAYLPPGIVSIAIGRETGPLMTCATVDGGGNRIKIYDVEGKKTFKTFNPHQSDLVCANLNVDATKVATASIKGTVIRVFDVHGNKQHEFRRGLVQTARIRRLLFSPKSDFLVCSGTSTTIHVCKFPAESRDWMTSLSNSVAAAAWSTTSMITGGVLDPLLLERSHTVVRLTENWLNYKLHGFMVKMDGQLAIVVSKDAKVFRIYAFDHNTREDCYIEKEFTMY